jgi:copper resistance protein B
MVGGRTVTSWLLPLVLLARIGSLYATATTGMSTASNSGMDMNDARIYAHALLDELEGRFGSGAPPLRWDGEAWLGTDANRLWFKSEGFAVRGRVQDGDHELLYDRPISTYFDIQGGVRCDLDSLTSRRWAAFGIEGLAPYWFDVSATFYARGAGHFAVKLVTSYDELLTQRVILQPSVELNLYTRSDPAREIGAGLSDLDAGVRLRYEITRKLAPYVGVVYRHSDGNRAANGLGQTERGGSWLATLGLRAWW